MESDRRQAVFEYIFLKADAAKYMNFDSSESSKFQDDLQQDRTLFEIAGEQLTRNYIKDTVLNNYSKKRRYISVDDVLAVLTGIDANNIDGTQRDLENGTFLIKYGQDTINCTSSSFSEWQTVIKRFGKRNTNEYRFAFLTCGGVEQSDSESFKIKDILKSYGITAFIVKPNESTRDISDFIRSNPNKSVTSNAVYLCKSFILLAGLSGTGKTRFIRKQAEKSGSIEKTYRLVPVRPDWHEPSDMLGYVSRLNTKPKYIVTDVLTFIVSAWQEIFLSDLKLERNSVSGNIASLKCIPPYWLCLDEMNLAPVEQYFSDYLSVQETREWLYNGDEFTYSCDPIIKADVLKNVDQDSLRDELGLHNPKMEQLWHHFLENGVSLPFNLLVAGTVNMDETTHGFSRKVIDRALSFDFGEFFPNDFNEFFAPNTESVLLTYSIWSNGSNLEQLSNTSDPEGIRSIAFLNAMNHVLEDTPFKLAYRALNELLISVISTKPQNERELFAVWDDFTMCKILPRIEGDLDKLGISKTPNIQSSILIELHNVLTTHAAKLIGANNTSTNLLRPDLYRRYSPGKERSTPTEIDVSEKQSETIWISCRSQKKLNWMQNRLETATFTSFWP